MFKIKNNKKACPPSACYVDGMRRGFTRTPCKVSGFTIIEFLIVIAIMALLVAVVLPSFSSFRKSQIISNTAEEIISSINKARSETLSSVNLSEYGVHFDTNQVVIFKGMVYSPSSLSNEIIEIASPAVLSSINFSGGGSDFYFNRISGAPSKTGTMTISIPGYSSNKTITILASGAVSSN